MGSTGFGLARRAALLGLVGALALAGCGDDEKSAGSGSGNVETSAAATPAKPSGPPIKVGSICSCSGAQAASLGSAEVGIKAWAEHVNTSGGINGHPVELVFEDDGGDPAKARRAVRKLVEQDRVQAIVSNHSTVDAQWADYATKKGIPVVGGLSIETPFLTSPAFFATGPSAPVGQVVIAKTLGELGKKSMRIFYCAESPICALGPKVAALGIQVAGVAVKPSDLKISSTAADYTAPCLEAKAAGVDAVYTAANATTVPRLMASCARQSFKPIVVAVSPASGPSWASDPAFDGAAVVGGTLLYTDDDVPAVKEFLDALEAVEPGFRESESFTKNAVDAWASGKLFETAAREAKLSPDSSPDDVKTGLYALKDETLGGLVAPLTFTKGKPSIHPCAFVHQIEDGEYKLAGDGKPVCVTEKQMTTLMTALQKLLS